MADYICLAYIRLFYARFCFSLKHAKTFWMGVRIDYGATGEIPVPVLPKNYNISAVRKEKRPSKNTLVRKTRQNAPFIFIEQKRLQNVWTRNAMSFRRDQHLSATSDSKRVL